MRRSWPNTPGFEDRGGGPVRHGMQVASIIRKGQSNKFFPRASRRKAAWQHLDFVPRDSFRKFDLQNYKLINSCYFKAQSLY